MSSLDGGNPLVQTFKVENNPDLPTKGRFLTSVDVYFGGKDGYKVYISQPIIYDTITGVKNSSSSKSLRVLSEGQKKGEDDAIAKNAPILLEDLIGDHLGEEVKNTNIATHFRHEFGNVEEGFESADLIVDKEVSLQMVHQGYIEPHNATAIWNEDDKVTVWSSTQGSFGVRDHTAKFIGVSPSSVRVNYSEIGGGFGGKTKVYLSPIAAILSKKSNGRPVKIVMDRPSVFQATGPALAVKSELKWV